MTKIVYASRFNPNHLDVLRQRFPEVNFVAATDVESQVRELADADGIISWPTPEGLAATKRLRWVHLPFAGIEGIRNLPQLLDMDGVVITNSRGAHAASIADHLFAFILSLTRNVPLLLEHKKTRTWDRVAAGRGARELSGSTLGIIGLGKIGTEIAKRGLGFDMHIRAVDLNTKAQCPGVDQVWPPERLHEFLPLVDYLAISIPITPQTEGMIGARELALMKPDAMVFVMSRGGIVDQDALAEALKNGKLAGAGLDATRPEPLPADHPLWDLPNVIISPHCSPSSRQTTERVEGILIENVRRFVADQPLVNLCDKRAGF